MLAEGNKSAVRPHAHAAPHLIEEREARYRSLVTATAQIVWITNAQGSVVEELPTWQSFTGQKLDEYLGSGWLNAVHPEDRERTKAVWDRAVALQSLYELEYRLRHHDGQYRDVAVRGVPVLAEDGYIREWVGTCTDITERKAAERRREFTNALLALFAQKTSAREYLDSVVAILRQWSNSEALGIRIMDENSEIPYESWVGFHPEFVELENRLSLTHDNCCCARAVSQDYEAQDRPFLTPNGSFCCDNAVAFLDQLPAEKKARYRGNCMKFGYASLAVVPIRCRDKIIGALHLADSNPGRFPLPVVDFIESMAPLIGEAVRRFQAEFELSQYRDRLEELVKQRTNELVIANARLQVEIAERQRAQEILQQTAQELERSNRDLEQFAYVASHDLQEPLRAVGGYVKLLQRRFPDELDSKALEYIAGAADGALRMERLITDLLAFARVGTHLSNIALTDLNALLAHALDNLRVSIRSNDAAVSYDQLPALRVDATRIVQLLQNLIGNALKFRSEQRPKIHIGATQQSGRWVFSVRDNGIGIDPQYFDRIFQIFQRLHTRKEYPGTGIGLAICKKIVERHGGDIWLESKPGHGSTFFFSLPEISPIIEPVA